MWPLGRRADRTHTLFRAHSSQLGSANRYRWLAPADSRCEDMPNTTPLPPANSRPAAYGTAHERPAVGDASAPTDAYPSSHPASHGMLGMPDVAAPRTPHSAHAQVPAAAYRRSGYRYSCTAGLHSSPPTKWCTPKFPRAPPLAAPGRPFLCALPPPVVLAPALALLLHGRTRSSSV